MNLDTLSKEEIRTEAVPKDCIEAAKLLSQLVKAVLLIDKDAKPFLVCILAHKKPDLKKTQEVLGSRRLSFAPESLGP